MSVLNELKRRHVFKVATAYLVVAWLVLQVADVTLGNFGAPGWVFRSIFVVLVVGFPVALLLAWAYQMTPAGLQRDAGADHHVSAPATTGRWLNVVIVGGLTIAVAYLLADRFLFDAQERSAVPGAPIERSIAVLPFRNRSGLAEDAHFVDGIHDDILTQLAKLSALEKVISSTSTAQYRDTTKTVPEIGTELDVAHVLEGGVQRAGNRVRINMQLIDTNTDEHLWADTYDRDLTVENIFDIQSEVTREVVDALEGVLSPEENERINFVPTRSLEAYDEFAKGRQKMAGRNAAKLREAQAHFDQAIKLDPEFSLAYAGLAEIWTLLVDHGELDWGESVAPRRAAIEKALELDPSSGEAYNALAILQENEVRFREAGRGSEEAESNFLRAIELSPNYALARTWYSFYLGVVGRHEEATPHLRKAVELDPNGPVHRELLAENLWQIGRIEEAQTVLRVGIEMHPTFHGNYQRMARLQMSLGNLGEAQVWIDEAARLTPTHRGIRSVQCHGLIELGALDAAEECFDTVEEEFPNISEVAYWRTRLLWIRGEKVRMTELGNELELDPDLYSDVSRLFWLYLIYGATEQLEKSTELSRVLQKDLYDESDINVNAGDFDRYAFGGYLLYANGDQDRADYVFDRMLDTMRSMHRTRGFGYKTWDVFIHITRGDKSKAIATLREAIDSGWRENWWMLKTWLYQSMTDEPEWNALIEELEADVAAQRQWYEENKDEPLF